MGNDISCTVRSRLLLPNTDDQQTRQWTSHYFDYANQLTCFLKGQF